MKIEQIEANKYLDRERKYGNRATTVAGDLIEQGPIDASHVVNEGGGLEAEDERRSRSGGLIVVAVVEEGFCSHFLDRPNRKCWCS